ARTDEKRPVSPIREEDTHRPGPAPALGLRAGGVGPLILPQTGSPLEDHAMLFPLSLRRWGRAHHSRPRRKPALARQGLVPRLEALEDRTLPSPFTVLNLADSGPGSLRQAVLDANAHPGANVIRFADDLHGTITLTSGQLSITHDLTIRGAGNDDQGDDDSD